MTMIAVPSPLFTMLVSKVSKCILLGYSSVCAPQYRGTQLKIILIFEVQLRIGPKITLFTLLAVWHIAKIFTRKETISFF